jgi:hypothetical protein
VTFEFESLTLGIISSKHLWGDLQGIKTKGGFGRQIEAFARYFGRIILVTPFQERSQPELGYIIQWNRDSGKARLFVQNANRRI